MINDLFSRAKIQASELNTKGFTVEIRMFKDGTFGDLERIDVNSSKFGGEIEFWSSGYIDYHLLDYETGEEYINKTFEPSEIEKASDFLNYFFSFIVN